MDNEDYEIGYRKPPKAYQFKSGQSGNQKGRPKDSRNTYTLLDEVLNQKIDIKENGKDLKITKKTAMIMQLVNKAVKGDTKAISTILPHMLIADAKEEEKDKILAALNQDEKDIIANYFKQVADFNGISK